MMNLKRKRRRLKMHGRVQVGSDHEALSIIRQGFFYWLELINIVYY